MYFKKNLCYLMLAVCAFSTNAFADRGNLYIKFLDNPAAQKVIVTVKDDAKDYSIECEQNHRSKRNNGPSCGFGFVNETITVSKIEYTSPHIKPHPVCEDLVGTQFSHGVLYIDLKKHPISCVFKRQKQTSTANNNNHCGLSGLHSAVD